MKKDYLRKIIREEIHRIIERTGVNLHGSEDSQRAFVMQLAKKHGGYISASLIAYTLGITRKQLQQTGYAKRIYNDKYRKTDDFERVRESVPFQSEAIYKLVGTPPDSIETLDKFADMETKLYKKTEGIFYPIYYVSDGQWALQGYLNVSINEPVKTLFDSLPVEDKKNCKLGEPFKKEPSMSKYKVPIVTMDTLPEFIQNTLLTPVDEQKHIGRM